MVRSVCCLNQGPGIQTSSTILGAAVEFDQILISQHGIPMPAAFEWKVASLPVLSLPNSLLPSFALPFFLPLTVIQPPKPSQPYSLLPVLDMKTAEGKPPRSRSTVQTFLKLHCSLRNRILGQVSASVHKPALGGLSQAGSHVSLKSTEWLGWMSHRIWKYRPNGSPWPMQPVQPIVPFPV